MTTTHVFDTEALRRGIEERDADTLLALYAEDAELRLVDRVSPPSNPRVLRGAAAIGAFLQDVCGREMAHAVERIAVQADTGAYLESCRYPDGTRVLCSAVLDLADGRILRQVAVQAWDE
ncbi:nuclear transport factor 2 family protein [Actinokineospora soli]|uniref:Nuclear transport factor 2 family protein n=1 Tax=Actinokineospora soli TaxID=1048753 RepID=A0ABW2TKG4_9PSEU